MVTVTGQGIAWAAAAPAAQKDLQRETLFLNWRMQFKLIIWKKCLHSPPDMTISIHISFNYYITAAFMTKKTPTTTNTSCNLSDYEN